jgi:hypothetical protein
MQDHLGVAGCPEMAAFRAKLLAQFDIVEDLAVEGDREIARRVGHGLLAIAQADYREPHMAEAGCRCGEESLLIRAPMSNGGRHPFKERPPIPDSAEIAAKTAHAEIFSESASPARTIASKIPAGVKRLKLFMRMVNFDMAPILGWSGKA